MVRLGNKWSVVIDGKEGKQYGSLVIVTLWGGKIVFDTPVSFHYLAMMKSSEIYLVEEKIEE